MNPAPAQRQKRDLRRVPAPPSRTARDAARDSRSGSTTPADDCSGVFELDLNAFARSPLASPALLVVGATVCAQYWGRDAGFAAPNAVMLSNAVRYDVQP